MSRAQCLGGPIDGREAAARPVGTRAWIDSAGRVFTAPAVGRALYQVVVLDRRRWWQAVPLGTWRCRCGAWIAPREGRKTVLCPLCGQVPAT